MRIFPFLVYCFYRLLSSSWRIRLEEHPETKALIQRQAPVILAHWHGDEYALIHLVRRLKLATMTSTSKDGHIMDTVIRRLGGATSRGSSTRGGVSALIGLVRLCRSGRIVSVAVDGPRGPIYQPKPGVFELSKLCRAHIVPVGVVAKPIYTFAKAWNKAYLPLPFAKVAISFNRPLEPISAEMNPKDISHPQQLAYAISVAKQQASKIIATM